MTVPEGLQGLQILQPLGADRAVLVAADTSSGARRLVLVERVTRASPVPAARTELLRRGRALKALEHPKVVRVRDVFERDGDVLVISDYVEGEWLSSLMMMQPRAPLAIMLRLVVDVLEGLGALHDLRDEQDRPLGFVHGAIAPDTVLVADDGVAEIARACRLPRPGTNERYVAPELRRGDLPPEPRCDIYAAGAILRDVLADAPADAKWAEPLTEIAWRACAVEPEDRWPSAAAMATTIRRIAGPRMATAATVADFVRRHFGATLRSRRAALESTEEGVPPSSGEPISLQGSELEVVELSSSSDVATLRPPPVKRDVAVGRIALVKKPSLVLANEDEVEPKTPPAPPRPGPAVASPQPPPMRPAMTTSPGLHPPPAPAAPPTAPTLPGLPSATPTLPAPPPTIQLDDADPTAAYRRQLPTFPTFDEPVVVPKQQSSMLLGLLVAGAMVVTFGLGWWLGRSSTSGAPTPVEPVPTLTASTVQPTQAAPPPSQTATAAPTPTSTPSASVSATPIASAAPSATAAAAATVSAAPVVTATATATATAAPTPPAWATAPRPTATATAPKPVPTVPPTATATTPKPTPTGGFVPSEL